MKRHMVFVLIVGLWLLVSSGCNTNGSPLVGLQGANLIANASFEKNGQPTLEGWFVRDSSAVQFAKDAPPGGGIWSLLLHAQMPAPLPFSPSMYIPLRSGRHVLSLAFWGKSQSVHGGVVLAVKRGTRWERAIFHPAMDTTWSHYTLQDTLTLEPGDSLFVQLFGGGSEVLPGRTYLDLVELVEIPDGRE